jgi:peptidoglycan hydrolase-like protein with peptidoglycan-binding domain
MGLTSAILSGNKRLDEAAAGGPAIKPAPPNDDFDAVKRIQKALVALRFPLPASFPSGPTNEPDGKFGQETYQQVIAFQKTAFPSDPTQWDGRVGKNTLGEMDTRLPKGAPKPAPPSLVVIPFSETSPMLISFEDHRKLSQNLEDSPAPPTRPKNVKAMLNLQAIRILFNTIAARELQLRRENAVLGGAVGPILATEFISNTISGREILFDSSHLISRQVQASDEFKKVNAQVAAFISDALLRSATTGIVDYHVLDVKTGNVPAPRLSFATLTPLQAAFGSMQGVKIFLDDFDADGPARTFRAQLTYEWFDHYGADDNTITPDDRGHGSPGQVALWIMQREDPPQRRPYIPRVVFGEEIRGSF